MKETCIRCKFYKIDDEFSGFCRAEAKKYDRSEGQRKMVRQDHSCQKWEDSGQQYYIRLGWIKAQSKKKQNNEQQ